MLTTFPQLLLQHAARRPDAPALREKEYGIWQTHSWSGLARLVEQLAAGLHQAGLQRHEHLVVIGANRPRLYATMLAAQSLGAIPVPLYQDAVAAECIFPLNNAEVRFCLVEDQEQVDKLLEIRGQCPRISNIYYDDPRGLRNYREQGLASLDALLATGKAFVASNPAWFQAEVAQARPDDVAAMFFTSGTTGNPKGVVHTHSTLLDRATAGAEFDKLTSSEEVLAYLPPAWIGQNIFSYAQWLACGYVVNCPESASTVNIDLREIGPTYYFAPPRVFEGMLTSVSIRMEDAAPAKQWLYEKCMQLAKRVGADILDGKPVSALDRFKYKLGDLLIYGPLRNVMGLSRIRVAYTAGAAIGPDLFKFFRSIGINLKQLYGQTETCAYVCIQKNGHVKLNTVGQAAPGIELKIADNGEVLVKGVSVLKEYYKRPDATAEVIDEQGYFHTGDAGVLDEDGHLRIIDRAKDVGKMNTGAMFAPNYIENKLKFFPQIKEAVCFGNLRDQVCTFINIDYEAVGNWAERQGIPYGGYVDLASKPQVLELISECLAQVNADLATEAGMADTQIARFLVLHKELDPDDDELTRTRKVRRNFIADKYAVLIDALYSDKTQQFIETQVKFEDGRTGSVSATLQILNAKTYPASRVAA